MSKLSHDNYTDELILNLDDIDDLIDGYVNSDDSFKDEFQTEQQKRRDGKVTELLEKYVKAYENKTKAQKKYRAILFWGSSGIIALFSIALLVIAIITITRIGDIKVTDVIALITALISFVTSILALTTIITKFCFPEDDEKYITSIVESIQKNDLENKKESMRLYSSSKIQRCEKSKEPENENQINQD